MKGAIEREGVNAGRGSGRRPSAHGDRARLRLAMSAGASALTLLATAAVAQPQAAGTSSVLPMPWPTPFQGVAAVDLKDSRQDFPRLPTAPAGAPNILLVLTDDVGFGAASTFGGPIPTPNLDRLAAGGLRFNRFHTTAMCSPTRAALLTGRNSHNVGTGALTDFAEGFPGYTTFLPKSAATVAEILRDNGYVTAWFGKEHNIPPGQASDAGPFNQWPTSIGFDYFYGFVGAETDQWSPQLYRDKVRQPLSESSEVLDKRLADDAIRWIHNVKAAAPDKPFFVYYAPGSTHTPHQAPADWIARFRGRFDQGWDAVRTATFARQKAMGLVPRDAALAPRSPDVPAWNTLSADERRVQARYMEVYAAMLSYQDAQLGRMLDELERMGQRDNTLVIFIEGDNGADAAGSPVGALSEIGELTNGRTSLAAKLAHIDEFGGPKMQLNYSTGWAVAMDTPFPYYKQIASHLGGTRNGMVMSWPAKITRPGLRTQYHHVIDVLPTILEAAHITPPEVVEGVKQKPIDGVSMTYAFDDPKAQDRRQTQYYEMIGNRAIYDHGWLAATTPMKPRPWMMGTAANANENLAAAYKWELYDLRKDFTQTHDLAAREPKRLAQMQALFAEQAAKFNVNPIDDRSGLGRFAAMRQAYAPDRSSYVYWGKDITLSTDAAPALANRSFVIEAQVRAPAGATGVIAALGSRFGGWSFYLKDGHPAVSQGFAGLPEDQARLVAAAQTPGDQPATVRFAFDYAGGGAGKGGALSISIDGHEVARSQLARSIVSPGGIGETFDIGLDRGVTVSDDYSADGAFPGAIDKVTVKLGPVGQAGAPAP